MTPHDLNLRHLAAVAAVLSAGTVHGAAHLVHLTQPAISQGISKIERQLGWKLFIRRPDGMEPTEAGAIVGRRAEDALRMIGTRRATNTQVRAFLAYARTGTYAAAATITGLSQASLHRAIADLSLALGMPLLERRGRALVLTRKGVDAVRRLALGMAEIQSALFELAALTGTETGRIVIGAMPLSRAKILPDAISSFHRSFPDVDLAILEGSYAELVGSLRDGIIDVMVGALRDEEMPDLAGTPLFGDHPAIIARQGHPLAARIGPLSAHALASFPWLVPGHGTPLRSIWQKMFESSNIVPPRVAIECGSPMTIRQLLLASDHLTLFSIDQVAPELAAESLVHLGPAPGNLTRTIGFTVRKDWRPTQMQAAFLARLRTAANQEK